jgi:hypothetical protein
LKGAYTLWCTAYYETSDREKKENFRNLKEVVTLEDIINVPKVYFNFKDDITKKTNIGTIAQEVQKKFPEIVDINNDSTLGVQYNKLAVLALLGVELLNDKYTHLEAEFNQLKEALNSK